MKKIIFLLIIFTSIQNGWGYNFTSDFTNGFYWKELPIKLAIDPNSPKREEIHTHLTKAITDWESRLEEKIWQLADLSESTSGHHLIRWSNNFSSETGMDSMTVLAVTIRYSDGPYFAKTEIILNGSNPTIYSTDKLLTILVHELGHTVGLDHSEWSEAVMYSNLIPDYVTLSYDDESGMRDLLSETKQRQAVSYVSPLSYKKEKVKDGVSCGTISDVGSGGGNAFMVLLSFMMGLTLALFTRVFKLKIA